MAYKGRRSYNIYIGTEQAQDQLKLLSKQANSLGKEIKKTEDRLAQIPEGTKEYDKLAKELGKMKSEFSEITKVIDGGYYKIEQYENILSNLTGASFKELSYAQGRARQDLVGLNQGTDEYIKKSEELRRINEAVENIRNSWKGVSEETRKAQEAKVGDIIYDAQQGIFTGTISETQEAIRLLEDYRKQLDTTDASGLEEVDIAITELNKKIKESQAGFLSLDDALRQGEAVSEGTFDGSIADLEHLKKTLEEYKKEIAVSNPDGLKQIETAIDGVEKKLTEVKFASVDLDDVLNNLDSKSFEDLQAAAEKLQAELKQTAQNTEEFATKSAQLRDVNKQLDEVKDNWKETNKETESGIGKVLKYVAAYAGIDQIIDKLKQWFNGNVELSDSLSAIQKTTGLSADAVASLSRQIDTIDTRASQEQLHDLAATAGQMGLTAEEDILGFVRASNQLTVALDELGNDGVATLVKINSLTGETEKMGLERALLASGSAINELSAASAASAGPIADVIKRLGGIGSVANLSTADLAAFGATTDALGQSSEVAGSSLTKFISTLVSKTGQVAQAVGIDKEYLQGLIDQGNTMEAIIAVFEKMKDMGGLGSLAPLMGDLGSEGARASALFATFAEKVEFLKEQLNTSRSAFNAATSATNEYNTVNENAAALVERIGNNIYKFFINSTFVQWIESLLRALMGLPQWIEKNVLAVNEFTAALTVMGTGLLMNATRITTFSRALVVLRTAMLATSKGLAVVQTAFSRLFAMLAAHPLIAAATALAAVAASIYKVVTAETEAEKAQKRLNATFDEFQAKSQNERRALNDVYDAIKRTTEGTNERKRAIDVFNKDYGKYLDKMLTEKSSAEEIKKAYDQVNDSLREQIALKMRNAATSGVYEESIKDQQALLGTVQEEMKPFVSSSMSDVMIQKTAEWVDEFRRAGKSVDQITYDVQRKWAQYYITNKIGYNKFGTDAANALNDYVKKVVQTENEVSAINKRFAPFIKNVTTVNEEETTTSTTTTTTTTENETEANKKKREMKQLYEDQLSIINEYYTQKAVLIKEKRTIDGEGQITEEEMNRQLLQNEKANRAARIRVQQTFLGETLALTEQEMQLYNLQKADMDKLTNYVKTEGGSLRTLIKTSLVEDELEAQNSLLKHQQAIQELLLKNNPAANIDMEYLSMLDELDLLFGETEQRTEQSAQNRIGILKEYAKSSNSLTAEGLRDEMELMTEFSEWAKDKKIEDYQALLLILQQYNKEMFELERKQQRTREQQFETDWINTETFKKNERTVKTTEENAVLTQQLTSVGLATDDMVNDAEIQLYRARLQAVQDYYNAKQAAGLMDLETEQQLADARAALAEKENEVQIAKLDKLKGYTDAVVIFGEQMGEAAFGEVEDRKAAGKQLLKTTLQLTKDLIMAEVKRLVMKKALGQQEIVQEQAKEQTITLTKGEHQIANITSDVAAAQGENVINTSRAGGKTLAELGWWGMPLIAVIGAALSALLSAAIGGASKAKSEIAAATGASSGRLATGMLTYAEGNYPVLGNDGNVYNAKYEGAGMKTGIYGGGAHFGIFSEKKPEAIIDGDTTQRLILNHPDIWQSIVTLSKTGRLDRGMRTFASGNIGEIPVSTSATAAANADAATAQNEMMEQLRALMTANMAVMNKLATEGVHSRIDMYGDGGLYKSMKKAESFANKRGYK